MSNELRYAVAGRPVSWQRSAVVNGRTLTPHANRIAKDAHRYAAIAAGARVQTCDAQGAYELHVTAHYPDNRHGDSDRLLGLPMDALEGLVYKSDRQVVKVSCERRTDRLNPRVEVVVRRIERDGVR
jgi:Holliday junction resolvase RusA-like endonuclease